MEMGASPEILQQLLQITADAHILLRFKIHIKNIYRPDLRGQKNGSIIENRGGGAMKTCFNTKKYLKNSMKKSGG